MTFETNDNCSIPFEIAQLFDSSQNEKNTIHTSLLKCDEGCEWQIMCTTAHKWKGIREQNINSVHQKIFPADLQTWMSLDDTQQYKLCFDAVGWQAGLPGPALANRRPCSNFPSTFPPSCPSSPFPFLSPPFPFPPPRRKVAGINQLGVWHRGALRQNFWVGQIPPSTSSSLPFTSSSLSLSLSLLSLLFEVDPSDTARDLGSAVNSSSGVWGGAPAESELVAF